MVQTRLSPWLDRLLVAIFLLAIGVPFVATAAGGGEEIDEEYRTAASMPAAPHDLTSLAAWPEAFTNYFADHFAFRSRLVRWQARLRVGILGASPTPNVLIGHNGWLFYGTDGAVEDFTGTRPFTTAELEAWRLTLQHTQDWLDRRGIAYAFVLAPDKHWVYPGRMPAGLNRHAGSARIDQLVDYLRLHSTVHVVDVREAMVESADDERLYHLTDTHWNDRGAFVAYQQLMKQIGSPLALRPHTLNEMEARVIPRSGFDLARMIGLGGVLVEQDLQLEPLGGRRSRVVEPARPSRALMHPRVVTEGPAGSPRAVVFRDSFGSAMIPFLSEHFGRVVYIWQNNFDPALVTAERPAVVIQEWVARHLHTATPYDALAPADAAVSSSAAARR
jgi:hypothetical protein